MKIVPLEEEQRDDDYSFLYLIGAVNFHKLSPPRQDLSFLICRSCHWRSTPITNNTLTTVDIDVYIISVRNWSTRPTLII